MFHCSSEVVTGLNISLYYPAGLCTFLAFFSILVSFPAFQSSFSVCVWYSCCFPSARYQAYLHYRAYPWPPLLICLDLLVAIFCWFIGLAGVCFLHEMHNIDAWNCSLISSELYKHIISQHINNFSWPPPLLWIVHFLEENIITRFIISVYSSSGLLWF